MSKAGCLGFFFSNQAPARCGGNTVNLAEKHWCKEKWLDRQLEGYFERGARQGQWGLVAK